MLNAGDIAIVALNADNPDTFSFVALGPIPAGEEILFTDNGVRADGTFRANEGTLKWTAPSDIAAGTVVTYTADNADFTREGGSFALSTSGDQVIAYQDNGGTPKFLYAVHTDAGVFALDATSSNHTALPPGLVLGETAVAISPGLRSDVDNGAYSGLTAAPRADLLAAIGDAANWITSSTPLAAEFPDGFEVLDGPAAAPSFAITEIWPGQSGTDVTEDWFEIRNTSDVAWTQAEHGPLYYDDESADATKADLINGLTELAPGETAIVVIGNASDAAGFRSVWGQNIDLDGVQVGHTDGAGLGGGGDAVNVWLGDPLEGGVLAATAAYPDTDGNNGASYDVAAGAFSQAGVDGAVTTNALGGDGVAAVGSPGNGAAVNGAPSNFTYTQSFENETSGSKYTDLGDAAVDHDLVNNAGQSVVDSENSGIAVNDTLAFDASYVNSRGDVGLTDGDFVGVTNFDRAVGSFTDGTQGYQLSDTDGKMVTTFETVDASNAGEVEVSLDIFINDTGYEAEDRIDVVAKLDGADDLVLFSVSGDDLEAKAGSWITLKGVVPAEATSIKLEVAMDSNSGSEAMYIDNVKITTEFTPDPVIVPAPEATKALGLKVLGTAKLDGAEIVDFDPGTDRAFVSSSSGINVVDASDPAALSFITTVAPADNGASANDVTSVSVKNGILAAAVPGADPLQPGQVFFYNANSLAFLGAVTVGALPDMVTFNETGEYLLVANEAQSAGSDNEPGVTPNPEGSVSVIKIDANDLAASQVTNLGFTDASLTAAALRAKGVRIDSAAPSVAADIEPEYITIDGNTAYVALQENNAVAVIKDITNPSDFTIDDIKGLGTKDHSVAGNELDASNKDGRINMVNYDVQGLYMPDGIASYSVGGKTYFVTANEGDGRGDDETRGAKLVDGDLSNGEVDAGMDPALRAQLADPAQLGRLKFSNVDGDTDGDGDIDVLHSFGGRSFTIFDEDGNVVFDSGSQFAAITASVVPDAFNSNGTPDKFDSRSDDKGVEPESVVVGEVGDATYAFIGLERVGGVMVYDVTDPANATFVDYIRTDGDIGPEGLKFVAASDSPTGNAMLGVASEISKTLTFYDIKAPEPDITLISTIQGAGDATPLDGQQVTVEAIVTASFLDGLRGFFVQEQEVDYDDSALTSEGIFVFAGALEGLNLNVGDLVQVTGTVGEFFDKTQISAEAVAVLDTNQTLPTATTVEFGPDLSPNLEAVESMRITIPEMVVTEMYNLDRFGTIRVADERLEQFTQNNAPDKDAYAAHVAEVARRSITIDDASNAQNPSDFFIPDGGDYKLTAEDQFRMGDTLKDLTGVLDYSFGEYKLQKPTAEHIKSNPRPEAPEALDGNFKVASLNVLNYFTTLNDGATTTSVGQGPRGANTAEELARQTTKVVNAIVGMDADVVGLIEIENHVDSAPLAALTAAVNAALGAEIYGFINTGQVGGDAITNAIMYKLATAKPVGVTDILDSESFLDPLNSPRDGLNRPAVTQSFEHIQSGEVLTVSVNHLKSKGSLSGVAADEDQGDGQGNNNATRAEAAKVLADHLATDPTGVGDGDVLIIGDMNAYAQEDPITALRGKGYSDIAHDKLGQDAYSYVFDGQVGTLDYILGKGGILDDVVGVTEWHINADEADSIDYQVEIRNNSGTTTYATRDTSIFDGDTAARNSDHDPVIVSFQFEREFNLIAGNDRNNSLRGTDGPNRFESGGGRLDRMYAGDDVDQFVFGSETQNGAREADMVYGFDITQDQLVLTDGAAVSRVVESGLGLRVIFEGDSDVLILRGRGMDADDLMIIDENPLLLA